MAFDKIVGVDGTTYQFPSVVRQRIADNIEQVGSVENLAVIDALGPALATKSDTTHNHTLASLSSNGLDELGDVEIGVVGGNGIALADKHTLQYESTTSKWRNKVASGGVTVSATPPATPIVGDAWFDSNDGTLYVYYSDGSSVQWVQVQANSALEGTILSRLGALEGRATALEADFPVSIANGGTGATTLSSAQDSLRVGLVPISPSTVTYTGTSATANTLGQIAVTACTQVTLNGVFTSAYTSYLLIFEADKVTATSNDYVYVKLASNGTPTTDTNYITGSVGWQTSDGSFQNLGGNGSASIYLNRLYLINNRVASQIFIHNPANTLPTNFSGTSIGTTLNNFQNILIGGIHTSGVAYDGMQIASTSSSTFTGTIHVFGMNK